MVLDAWLPIGHRLPDGAIIQGVLFEGVGWQIVETQGHGRALLVSEELAEKWVSVGLVGEGAFGQVQFGDQRFMAISCGPSQALCPVSYSKSPDSKSEALAFALALKATRLADKDSPLQDSIYLEKLSRLLPTYSISSRMEDEVVLGYWLTGGANVSVKSFRRLGHMLSWLAASHLKEVIEAAGFQVAEVVPSDRGGPTAAPEETGSRPPEDTAECAAGQIERKNRFELPGCSKLEAFFNEHVVDIVQNRERYRALGIGFPSAIVLHGPPGCGKTFAVERLVEFLGWPSFQIDASSIASPYIHETSRRVAEIFDKAIENAPSILVIDEMEAFLADRESGSGHHRVEEVAEFLRRIPEAAKKDVLVVAMTNRLEMIDSAILRRGRFDQVIKVDYADEGEILSLLARLLSTLPIAVDVDVKPLAKALAGKPLSDVTFVVREGARLAARSGKHRLDQESLLAALQSAHPRDGESGSQRSIGFI